MSNNKTFLNEEDWEHFLSFKSAKRYVDHMLNLMGDKDSRAERRRFQKLIFWYGNSAKGEILKNIKVLEPTNSLSHLYRARIYEAAKDSDRNKDKSNTPFKGYNQEESFVPPHENASEGRANSSNIVYLYAANDAYTSVIETAKSDADLMSVAKIRIKSHLFILDFSIFYSCEDAGELQKTIWIENFILEIAKLYQMPAETGSCIYLMCQFISEIAIKLNCQGVQFYSSKAEKVHGLKKSINYVIFDCEECEAVSSELILAKDVIENWRRQNGLSKI